MNIGTTQLQQHDLMSVVRGVMTNLDCFSISIALSEQQDSESLSEVLLMLLRGMPFTISAELLEVVPHDENKLDGSLEVAPLSLKPFSRDLSRPCYQRLQGELAAILESAEPRWMAHEDKEQTCLVFPVPAQNGRARIVVLNTKKVDAQCAQDMEKICQIYANYVQALDGRERDALTGLLNRQTFDRNLQRVLAEQNYHQRSVDRGDAFLAVLDIDHFKRINDTWGHLYGDEILLLFARLMEQCFRDSDLLFRFGGEEFIVVLTHTEKGGARGALERFRHNLSRHDFPTVGNITASIGYAPLKGDNFPSLYVDRADQALYYAKDAGRNQVICYDDLGVCESASGNDVELF